MLKLTAKEVYIINELTKPSKYERLYKNLPDLESTNTQLNSFLEKSNYSKVTDIYTRKSIIKQSIIKNQLGLLLIYQTARTSKSREDKFYYLNLNSALVSILLETLTLRSLRIESVTKKREMNDREKMELKIIDDIINKISNSYDIEELYSMSKKMHSNLDILTFKTLVGDLK